MKFSIVMILLVLSSDCAVRRDRTHDNGNEEAVSASTPELNLSSAVDAIAKPEILVDSFKLGNLQFPRLRTFTRRGTEMYYDYKVCNASDCSVKGKLYWGAVLLPTVAEGNHT